MCDSELLQVTGCVSYILQGKKESQNHYMLRMSRKPKTTKKANLSVQLTRSKENFLSATMKPPLLLPPMVHLLIILR